MTGAGPKQEDVGSKVFINFTFKIRIPRSKQCGGGTNRTGSCASILSYKIIHSRGHQSSVDSSVPSILGTTRSRVRIPSTPSVPFPFIVYSTSFAIGLRKRRKCTLAHIFWKNHLFVRKSFSIS